MRVPARHSFLVVLSFGLAFAACVHESRDDDPYAARYAAEKPAYVRAPGKTHARPVADIATDPQFTLAQATAGAEVYGKVCARCHASAQWQGGTFAAGWRDRRVSDFYDLVSAAMPQDAPGTLTTEQYVNVTAHILHLAGLKSGDVALRADTAVTRHARIHLAVSDTSQRLADAPSSAPTAKRGKKG